MPKLIKTLKGNDLEFYSIEKALCGVWLQEDQSAIYFDLKEKYPHKSQSVARLKEFLEHASLKEIKSKLEKCLQYSGGELAESYDGLLYHFSKEEQRMRFFIPKNRVEIVYFNDSQKSDYEKIQNQAIEKTYEFLISIGMRDIADRLSQFNSSEEKDAGSIFGLDTLMDDFSYPAPPDSASLILPHDTPPENAMTDVGDEKKSEKTKEECQEQDKGFPPEEFSLNLHLSLSQEGKEDKKCCGEEEATPESFALKEQDNGSPSKEFSLDLHFSFSQEEKEKEDKKRRRKEEATPESSALTELSIFPPPLKKPKVAQTEAGMQVYKGTSKT